MSATRVELRDVLDGLAALRAQARDLRPVFRDVREALQADVATHVARQEGPDRSWPPRSRAYIEQRLAQRGMRYRRGKRRGEATRRGQRFLSNVLGRFQQVNTYRFTVTPQSLEMRARAPWAGVHQFGGVAGRGVRIPQRQFLWASDRLMGAFAAALARHIRGGW